MIPLLALTVTVPAAILGIYKYWTERELRKKEEALRKQEEALRKEAEEKNRYIGEALTCLDRARGIVESLHNQIGSHGYGEVYEDIEVIMNDLLRSWFESKKGFEIWFRVRAEMLLPSDKETPRAVQIESRSIPAYLEKNVRLQISTGTEIVGSTRPYANSPGFDEMLQVSLSLNDIWAMLLPFRTAYESLGSNIFDYISESRNRVNAFIGERAKGAHFFVNLGEGSEGEVRAWEDHLADLFLGYSEFRKIVAESQGRMLEDIRNVQRELFKLSYSPRV